jgi:hypothetical protein
METAAIRLNWPPTFFGRETTVARPLGVLALCGALALAGCSSDKRFDKLTAGISKDSTLALIGVEKPLRTDPYLVGGHYIEAMYYAKPGAAAGDTLDRKLTPVIVVDGTLAGWGWKKWDSIAGANKIVVQGR